MSTIIGRLVRTGFIVGVLSALAFGAHAAFAAHRVSQCECDPQDPDRNRFCEECCMATGSVCPIGGGTEPRECICA